MKRTPLYDAHIALGAKMVEFGGWEMPIQYSTILEEHRAVRERAGMFDVSHMGDLIIHGEGAETSLRELLTNDIAELAIGKGIYSHILNEQGKPMDDTITFRLGEETYLMVPNASTAPRIYEWVKDHVKGATVVDVSERIACIALQGPQADTILQKMTTRDLKGLKRLYGELVDIQVHGLSADGANTFLPELLNGSIPSPDMVRCLITRTGYTGEDGFEILVERASARSVWDELLTQGKDLGLRPCGLGARDLLRLEMGYLLSGTDFDGTQTTLESGPEWVVKWDHRFVGREALLKQKDCAVFRKLIGLEMMDRGIPRHGHVVTFNNREIGKVTSGTLSPILGHGIALAYININHTKEGEELMVKIRDSAVRARVIRPPFIKRG